jgi:hypothetical protein
VMSCASLARPRAVFSGIRVLPSRVMNQFSEFSLAPVSWACSLPCGLYSGQSQKREGKAYLAGVVPSFCTSSERATSFAILSADPFP